jgi:hypothetical protein
VSKQSNFQPSRFSSNDAKSHLGYLLGQIKADELQNNRQASNEPIKGQHEQVTGQADDIE